MTEFEKIVIGKSSIPSLIITVLLMIAIPVGCFLHWHGKHKQQTKISYLIAGAIGFILSARVLELGVHYVCVLADNPVSRFINGNTWAFVLYGTMMAGVFEECGRHIILKYILKKNRTRENAVLYGIGHGGIEILAVLLPSMILYLVIAILFSQGNVEEAMNQLKITEETAVAALPSVQGYERCGTAVCDVPPYRAYGDRILRRHQRKERLPAAGHSSAYADGYLSRIVPKGRGAALDGGGLGCVLGCGNWVHCSQTLSKNERAADEIRRIQP